MIRYDKVRVTHDSIDVLRDFSLDIDRGEKVLIYGKSGIGKSTVLKLLLGFAQPDSGTIYYQGEELDKKNIWELRKKVAYVSQDMDIAEGKVCDFIDGVLSYKANSGLQGRGEKMHEVMDFLELGKAILEKEMVDISGGEKQRIALTIAILLQRDIFLLDEVTSAIDIEMKKKVVDYFVNLEGATVLAVSHDVNWLQKDGMRVIRLEVG